MRWGDCALLGKPETCGTLTLHSLTHHLARHRGRDVFKAVFRATQQFGRVLRMEILHRKGGGSHARTENDDISVACTHERSGVTGLHERPRVRQLNRLLAVPSSDLKRGFSGTAYDLS